MNRHGSGISRNNRETERKVIKKQHIKRLELCLAIIIILQMILGSSEAVLRADAAELPITAPSAILMEASTGQIIYEKNPDEKRSPASITKIMTMLLAFEAIENGRAKLTDELRTSAHAKSMGGSQVFLEEGEIQTLETLIKCIAISSGNDAAVTVAEYLAGSEEEFVYQMNKKAEQLGMTNTHFEDCCGLTASDNHYTTAADVAVMSRELITKYPEVFNYTKIWMEDITHVTNRGSETFTLSSTNKLLKSYQWTTGLKTGSTSKAKFCLSATALKDNMEMIAVIMGAENGKIRFAEAITLLNYGYSVSHLYEDKNAEKLEPLMIKGAVEEQVEIGYQGAFRYLDTTGQNLDQVEKIISLPQQVEAPVKAGDVAGEAIYKLHETKIGSVPILYTQTVEKAGYKDFVRKVYFYYLLGA